MFAQTQFPSDAEAKKLMVDIGQRMYKNGYVVTNDGNITCKVSPTEIWVTPTGVSKGFMTEDMMIKMDLDGKVLHAAGGYQPSSEVKMHLRVFKENPDANGVVHAHPVHATAFAVAGVPLDEPILVESILQLGCVPVAGYAKPGTYSVPDSIAPFCKDYDAVLLANHGALTWGGTLLHAYYRMEVLEAYAKITLFVKQIGQQRPMCQQQIDELQEIRMSLGMCKGTLPKGAQQPTNLDNALPKA